MAATKTAQTAEAAPASPCAPPDAAADEDTLTPVETKPAPAEPAEATAAADGVKAHCSQNAGNQQYQDPFAGAKPPSGGNGGSQSGGDGTAPATSTTSSGEAVVSQGTVTGQDTGTTAESAGPSLPNTGLGLGGLLALGLPLLAGGIALRARLA